MHKNNTNKHFPFFRFVLHHSFSKIVSQTGLMTIPPLSLPFGGQITRINTDQLERSAQERSRLSKHRSLSKHNNQETQTVKINS